MVTDATGATGERTQDATADAPPRQSPRANRGPAAGPGNRRALVAAAREVFATEGLNAPLSSIAKRAGVGQGSLYRHFPDRTALAVAVFDDNVAELEELTAAPDRTLVDLFDAIATQAIASTALIDLVSAHRNDPGTRALGERFLVVLTGLFDRDRAAGRLGAHVEVADVMLAVSMFAGELARADEADRTEVARRARGIFRTAFAPR